MLQRKIMRIIHNQALCPILVQMSHEFGLARAPMSSEWES